MGACKSAAQFPRSAADVPDLSLIHIYLRPLYDALFDMLGAETYQKYVERGSIEVAPLAYMRGRTPVSYTHLRNAKCATEQIT